MRRSTVKLLCVLAGIVALILAVVCMFAFRSKGAGYAVLAIYVPIGIWLNFKLRCPHCGAWPRKGHFFHEYCPCCGKPLE